jgi:hypothetical protein
MPVSEHIGSRVVVKVIMAALVAVTCGSAAAQEKLTGGPTPSPPGAQVYFAELKDRATIPTKVTIRFGLREMGVAPAGTDRPNSGHHHLLIDTELPALDQPIPNDFNHLHFGNGQTEAEITLKPGTHTLQLLFADKDHVPHNPPVMSARISVIVTDAPAEAAAPVRKRARAQASARTKTSARPQPRIYRGYSAYPSYQYSPRYRY